MRIAHRFRSDPEGKRLRLDFEFDPRAVLGEGGASPVELARAGLARYASAVAQLEDPRTRVGLRTTVLPAPGEVGEAAEIKAQLLAYARRIEAQLLGVVEGHGAAEPVGMVLEAAIDPTGMAALAVDVVPVEVTLTLSRPAALVYADGGGARVEKSQESSLTVAADLEPDEPPSARAAARGSIGGEEPSDVTLLLYAEDFEATFAGWDGEQGTARLAVRSDQQDLAAAAGPAPLWALRMSSSAGIEVRFAAGEAAYFSLAPLDVQLVGGAAQVPRYDESLKPEYEAATFTGIDLDQWGEAFLAAMDEVLSPGIGTAIAAEDAVTYGELMQAKSVLAEALAQGVQPVFGGTGSGVVEGDIESARDVFEQTVLGRLGAAFALSAIVQVPATVSGHSAPGPQAPRLFGVVAAASAPDDITLGSAKLSLASAPSDSAFSPSRSPPASRPAAPTSSSSRPGRPAFSST